MSMAAKGTARRQSTPSSSSWFAPFLCLASLLLLLLIFFSARRSSVLPQYYRTDLRSDDRHDTLPGTGAERRSCNYSDGSWVLDPDSFAPRYDQTCKEIFKGWNCIANEKTNGRDLLRWRWQPSRCRLRRLDPRRFLRRFRNYNIVQDLWGIL